MCFLALIIALLVPACPGLAAVPAGYYLIGNEWVDSSTLKTLPSQYSYTPKQEIIDSYNVFKTWIAHVYSDDVFLCTGALVSANIVIAPAHCLSAPFSGMYAANTIVLAPDVNVNKTTNGTLMFANQFYYNNRTKTYDFPKTKTSFYARSGFQHRIVSIAVHPNYTAMDAGMYHDVALAVMDRPWTTNFSPKDYRALYFKPVTLAESWKKVNVNPPCAHPRGCAPPRIVDSMTACSFGGELSSAVLEGLVPLNATPVCTMVDERWPLVNLKRPATAWYGFINKSQKFSSKWYTDYNKTEFPSPTFSGPTPLMTTLKEEMDTGVCENDSGELLKCACGLMYYKYAREPVPERGVKFPDTRESYCRPTCIGDNGVPLYIAMRGTGFSDTLLGLNTHWPRHDPVGVKQCLNGDDMRPSSYTWIPGNMAWLKPTIPRLEKKANRGTVCMSQTMVVRYFPYYTRCTKATPRGASGIIRTEFDRAVCGIMVETREGVFEIDHNRAMANLLSWARCRCPTDVYTDIAMDAMANLLDFNLNGTRAFSRRVFHSMYDPDYENPYVSLDRVECAAASGREKFLTGLRNDIIGASPKCGTRNFYDRFLAKAATRMVARFDKARQSGCFFQQYTSVFNMPVDLIPPKVHLRLFETNFGNAGAPMPPTTLSLDSWGP